MKREDDVVSPPGGSSTTGDDDAHFLRTIRSVWQSSTPDRDELDRAWRRYQLRPRASRTFPRGAMLGLAVGVVSSLATAAVVVNWSRVSETKLPAAAAKPDPTEKAVVHVRSKLQRRAEPALPDGAAPTILEAAPSKPSGGLVTPTKSFGVPVPAPTVGAVPGASRPASVPPSTALQAPPGAQGARGQASALAAGSTPATEVSTAPAGDPAPAASPTAAARFPSTSAWERANAALERGDRVEAERALGELAVSSDAATRDAATLARAQLWVSSGELERARPVLGRLSRSGATALVRERAAALLQRMR